MPRSVQALSLSSILYVKHIIKYLAVIYSGNDTENNKIFETHNILAVEKMELLKNYLFLR